MTEAEKILTDLLACKERWSPDRVEWVQGQVEKALETVRADAALRRTVCADIAEERAICNAGDASARTFDQMCCDWLTMLRVREGKP